MARARCSRVQLWTAAAFVAGVMTTSSAWAQSQAAESQPASAVAAPAQPRPAPPPRAARQWAIAVRGGLAISSNPSSGTSQLPATLNAVVSGPTTPYALPRMVSSWFFGDGTAQLNQVTQYFGIPRATPLDTVLENQGVHYGPTGGIGVTLTRDLAPRWAVNLNLDVDLRANTLSAVSDATVEEARGAFVTSWQGFLAAIGSTGTPTVTATRTGTTSSGRQFDTTATLTYQLGGAASKSRPFVEFGGGAATMTGDALSATLVGDYAASFRFLTTTTPVQVVTVPFHQTDTVTVHWQNGGSEPVGVVGAGISRAFSPTRGFRAQVRVVAGSNNQKTTLDATPISATLAPPNAVGLFTPGGSVIMSNNPQLPNSLSGPTLTGFKTFSSSGLRIETTLSLAYYIRF